jgi:transcriptional regulator with XRE-family HTH domain
VSRLAEALATARKALGLSQEQLAELANVTQGAISRYEGERRDPPPEVVERLADALGVTPAFLHGVGTVKGAWAIDAHLRRRATARARFLYEEIDLRTNQVVP